MADNRIIELKPENADMKEKFEKIFSDEAKFKQLLALTENDEIFAFLAENGIEFSEEEKERILKDAEIMKAKAKKIDTSELTEEQLESVAGGWSWGAAIFSGGMAAWVFSIACTAWPAIPICTCALVGIGVGILVGSLVDD